MTPADIPGRLDRLEDQVKRVIGRLEDYENEREALALLPDRVADLRTALLDVRDVVGDFREDCKRRFDALTQERPDGTVTAAPTRLDVKTWLTIVATIAVPIVAAIIATKG